MKISILKSNIFANLFGKAWAAIMSIAFIPEIIKMLGIEAYGLVGLFITIQAIFSILDLGLTPTLSRDLARYSALADKAQEMRNLVRTLEIIYWGISISIGILMVIITPYIANSWIKVQFLPLKEVQQAILIMGLSLIFQFPLGFYYGGLQGLQKQIIYNSINACAYTLRFGGVIIFLRLTSISILAFCWWQLLINLLTVIITALFLWKSLPRSGYSARFKKNALKPIWRFAGGMAGISITILIITQLDKVILSKMLSLEKFSYYIIAVNIANVTSFIANPLFTALFPRFSQLVAENNIEKIKALYHRSCQIMSIMLMPGSLTLILFSSNILSIWTKNIDMVKNTHLLVSLIVVGRLMNGLLNLPYAIQLAYGWTKLSIYINIISIAFLAPILFIVTPKYGAIGAAIVWILLNLSSLVFSINIMHRKLLKGEKWLWYIKDVGLPLIITLSCVGIFKIFANLNDDINIVIRAITILFVFSSTSVLVSLVTPYTRNIIKNYIHNKIVCRA